MQPAFLSLILIAVHVSLPVDCRMRVQNPEQLLQHQQSSINTHADASASRRLFHLELSGLMSKDIHRHFLDILPIRTNASNFVSIFDLRRRRFLCMGLKGKLYSSRQKDREDCLFQRIWLDLANHHDMFYSISGGRLLKLEGAEPRVALRELPEWSSALVEKLMGPLVKRQRRSEEVNPSDPLRSESHPPNSEKEHKDADHGQTEQDQTGAVSKETITSCDDPLRVLQPNGPVSPVKTNIADRAEEV